MTEDLIPEPETLYSVLNFTMGAAAGATLGALQNYKGDKQSSLVKSSGYGAILTAGTEGFDGLDDYFTSGANSLQPEEYAEFWAGITTGHLAASKISEYLEGD